MGCIAYSVWKLQKLLNPELEQRLRVYAATLVKGV